MKAAAKVKPQEERQSAAQAGPVSEAKQAAVKQAAAEMLRDDRRDAARQAAKKQVSHVGCAQFLGLDLHPIHILSAASLYAADQHVALGSRIIYSARHVDQVEFVLPTLGRDQLARSGHVLYTRVFIWQSVACLHVQAAVKDSAKRPQKPAANGIVVEAHGKRVSSKMPVIPKATPARQTGSKKGKVAPVRKTFDIPNQRKDTPEVLRKHVLRWQQHQHQNPIL